MRGRALLLLLCALAAGTTRPAGAQQDARIRQQREELERIRQERAELERQMARLQTTAHDLSAEVVNIDRRADATSPTRAANSSGVLPP